jgi:hypothetical protein
MTTTVKIEAHHSTDKQVRVRIYDTQATSIVEEFTLQDGEKAERYVYDGRMIQVHEENK